MSLFPMVFKPGISRDRTNYSNSGGWWDCNWIRFRDGLPEKMGGWTKQIATAFIGVCRSLFNWTVLSGQQYISLGTSAKFYITDGVTFTDVTPIKRTVTLGTDPFQTTNGSALVVVTDTGSGAVAGSYVTFSGATTFSNFTSGEINAEFTITSTIDANTYRITMPHTANSSVAGGGAAVVAAYQIDPGFATSSAGTGWGTGPWGRGGWGSSYTSSVSVAIRLWVEDNFGEDLLTCIRDGGIYYWDATTPTARMVALSSMSGGSDVPFVATEVHVSAQEHHAIAFGTNPIGTVAQDPLFVRWSSSEDVLNWTPAITNTAGGYRLSVGTYIVAAERTRSQLLIWTDVALYTMTWTGGQFVFSFDLVGTNVSTISPNAAIAINDLAIWMGKEQFFVYDGRINPIECSISDYIFRRLNYNQVDKISAFTNGNFNEVGWLYPSTTDECDSYVIYNYRDQIWYYGSISRTSWLDRGPTYSSVATSADSYLYNQETGLDDGSTTPAGGINAYIESSPFENADGGQGQRFMFMTRIIPDVTFRNSSAVSPSLTMTLSTRDYPGGAVSQTYPSSVTQTSVVTVEQFTEQCFIRLRGRSVVFKIASTAAGVTWRAGTTRVDYRLDGRR